MGGRRRRVKQHRRKYNNVKVEYEGRVFDSRLEMRMYRKLRVLEKEGKIKNLECQVKFELQPRFEVLKRGKVRVNRPITYTPDFVFYDIEEDRKRVLDAKGARTPIYLLKKKLFEWVFRDEGLYIETTI